MTDPRSRYPLTWPPGWPRTTPSVRQRARFRRMIKAYDPESQQTRHGGERPLTVSEAIDRLAGELGRLGAVDDVLSTNVPVRADGRPRSGQPEPADPRAAVYFLLKGEPRCLACDAWTKTADNIAALAAHIEAIRAVERYGVGSLEQAFRGYVALPQSTPTDWPSVLGLDQRRVTRDAIETAYRRLAFIAHPDQGGSHDQMTRLNTAREAALKALGDARSIPMPRF